MTTTTSTFTQRKRRHQRLLHVMTKDNHLDVVPLNEGGRMIFVDEAYTAADTALLLAKTVRLARTSRVARHVLAGNFAAAYRAGNLSSEEFQSAKELRHFLGIALKVDTDNFRIYFPEYRVHPDIGLGLEAIETAASNACHLPRQDRMFALLREIVRLGNKPEYVDARACHRKARGKRMRETKDYLNEIFRSCKRQLAVRIDLGYDRRDAYDGQGTVRSGLTFKKVNSHRRRLRTAMRKAWGKDFSGSVLRLEWAPHKTYHFHLLVLLNGYKFQSRTHYAKEIGRMWKKASFGLGTSWEPEPHEGESRGTGTIRGDRPEEMAGLIMAASYLCKADHYIGYYKEKRDRTFFHGRLD